MAERYLKLFTLQPRLYLNGSPIIIEAGALHKDTVVGDVVAQLKFSSLVSDIISEIIVDIACYNAAKEIIVPSFVYKYEHINNNPEERFFGQKTLITLPSNEIRAFSAKITKVRFADGNEIVLSDGEWKNIPEQQQISAYDSDFVNYLKVKYGNYTVAEPILFEDIWLCTCQKENKNSNNFCTNCGAEYSTLFPFDIEEERKSFIYDTAQKLMEDGCYDKAIEQFEPISDWKDVEEKVLFCQKKIEEIKAREEAERLEKERQAEIERIEAEKRAKRNKKFALISISSVCGIIAFLLVFIYVIAPAQKKKDFIAHYGQEVYDKLGMVEEGAYITFGTYEQDGTTSNGKEDVEWLVLEVKDDKALVISKYALECKPYNTIFTDVTWETCTLRKWLNEDFINSAFSAEEKAAIPMVTISTAENVEYSINSGNETQDNVFLLSIEELNHYFDSNAARTCKPTKAVVSETFFEGYDGNCSWWSRAPGFNRCNAACSSQNGSILIYGLKVDHDKSGVRPAMWIDLAEIK